MLICVGNARTTGIYFWRQKLATSPNSRFPELLQVQVPHGLKDALNKLADRQHMTPSELTRRALLNVVQLNGVSLPERDRERVPA